MLKNIPQNEALLLTELIPYQAGQVVSRTLSQNPHVSVTLFAFDKGEEISTHDSDGDALALVLSGRLHGGRQSPFAGSGRMCSHARPKAPCPLRRGCLSNAAGRSFPRMTKRLFFTNF